MFSATPETEALAIDALTQGASDYVGQSLLGPATEVIARLHADLARRLRGITAGSARPPKAAAPPAPRVSALVVPPRAMPSSRVTIVAIGASTRGPNAVTDVHRPVVLEANDRSDGYLFLGGAETPQQTDAALVVETGCDGGCYRLKAS